MNKPLRGGPERCPLPCSECDADEHHMGDSYIQFSEDEPEHPAAKIGLLVWWGCKHCDAWSSSDEDAND